MSLVTAVATAKTNVDLSRHLDCFLGRGLEILGATPDSQLISFAAGTPIGEVRDRFAAGLIGLLVKLPDSGASAVLAKPIRVSVTTRRAGAEMLDRTLPIAA